MSSSTWATELSRHEPQTIAELYERYGERPEGWLCAFPRDGEIFVIERLVKVIFASGFVGYEVGGFEPLRYWGVVGTISGAVSVWRRPADSRISVSDWSAGRPLANPRPLRCFKFYYCAWNDAGVLMWGDANYHYPKAAPDER